MTIAVSRLDRLLIALDRLWFVERASAHILAGWIVKIPAFDRKIKAATYLYQSLRAAQQIERSAQGLRRAIEQRARIPSVWRDQMLAIDRSSDDASMLTRLLEQKRSLIPHYAAALRDADEILNAPLVAVLQAARADLESQLAQSGTGEVPTTYEGELLDPREVLWAPIDRVTSAARPLHVDLGVPGALRPIARDPDRDPAGIAMVLHNNINGEYTTMELVARNSYEHPSLPIEFHADMARQASDEARHALGFERLAEGYGVQYGDLPVYTHSYDVLYQYPVVAPGSRDELLWRLLLRSTVQEADSLDDLLYQTKRRANLEQDNIAELFAQIFGDEMFHVHAGLKWSRQLAKDLDKDPLAERARARGFYEAGILIRRHRFVKENPREAQIEAETVEALKAYRRAHDLPLQFKADFNHEARRAAGFTEAEIAQAASWERLEIV